MSEELADWEYVVVVSPEEQAQIDALRRASTIEGERDALETRLVALQADVDLTKAQLAALDCTTDCDCESACEAVEPQPEQPTPEPEADTTPDPEVTVEEPAEGDEAEVTGKSVDLNAADAVTATADYTDADALKAWADGDDRRTVVTAVEKKLAELG